ncbi:hypothetical protein SRHO_G00139990 [Serrasalmus rhombeus]
MLCLIDGAHPLVRLFAARNSPELKRLTKRIRKTSVGRFSRVIRRRLSIYRSLLPLLLLCSTSMPGPQQKTSINQLRAVFMSMKQLNIHKLPSEPQQMADSADDSTGR